MNNESPIKALMVVISTALVCSILVTISAVTLQPLQQAYKDLERNRHLVAISGLTNRAHELSDREIVRQFQELEPRIVDLDKGDFDQTYNPVTFDTRKAASDPQLSIAIPVHEDLVKLGRRSRFLTVYLVKDDTDLKRIILPIYGQGMWSTLYGFIALEADLNTIADITFYEQGETAGIGDQILRREWQLRWQGQKLYDETGAFRFHIVASTASISELEAAYQIDALTGATVTSDAVGNVVRYWFGMHGFAPFLAAYRDEVHQ